jgi:ATP-binding cassette subfamily B multidrug efflux pump
MSLKGLGGRDRSARDAREPGGWTRAGGQQGGRGFGGGGPMGLVMPVEKPKNAKNTLARLLGYFRPELPLLAVVLLASIASTVFSILSPKILGNITTVLFQGMMERIRHVPGGGVNFPVVLHLLEWLAALYVLSSIFSWVQQYVMAGVAQRTVYGMRREVMEKLTRLPVSFFDTHPHGEILSRFVNDFDNIGSTLQQTLTQAVTAAVTFLGVVVMMLTISPLLTVVIALTLPLSFVVTRVVARRSQRHFLNRQRRLGALNGHVEEMYTGHVIVKAYGHEDRSIQQFEAINAELTDSTWRAQFITGAIMPLMNVIGNLGYVLVSVIGGILVARGAMPIGDIQAFIQYARQFSQPITQLSSVSNVIQSALASTERVFEILDEPEESPEPETAPGERGAGAVAFQAMSFRYREDQPLIDDMTIQVEPGQTVAIVGPTGAGKTTLVNLLMRFYDPNRGRILIDGQDIQALPRGELRQRFGMVLQDTWLFSGTIRDNIAYGRPGHTELNEEASNISQGQRQLLTIARAFLANPPMLILDEATSSVDTRTEMAIQDAMRRLMHGRTSFVIAHRLSTIRDADLILVMDHGRVIEQGTHQTLMDQRGFYYALYQSQFQGREVVPAGAAG